MTEVGVSQLHAIAETLTGHATRVEQGEKVLLIMREPETFPLVRSVAACCIERGASVQTLFYSMAMQRDLLLKGTVDQIDWVPEVWCTAMKWADVCIDIRGARNLAVFAGISAERIARLRRSEGEVSALRTNKTRWTIIRVPNESFAQQAGLSLDEVNDLFFRSVLQDWDMEAVRYRKLRDALVGSREVRIVGAGTDLSLSVEGRVWLCDEGHINMPGGEVYTSPVEDSVEGTISFENPGVLAGVLIDGIVLQFRHGAVVDAAARTNEAFLHEVLSMDTGARRVGEFGIGTNREIDRFTNDILWDEKIEGTVHIALGRSYKECGGTNVSSLHWDIVKDLRTQGAIIVDGTSAFDGGEWILGA